MVKLPVEHSKATEMIYVLMKYEGAAWGHRKKTRPGPKPDPTDFNFSELQSLLENKYLRHYDLQIPLHVAAKSLSRSTACVIHYMTARVKSGGGKSNF